MKALVSTMVLFGLMAVLIGCGESSQEIPAGAPAVIMPPDVSLPEQPAETGGAAVPESPAPATDEATRQNQPEANAQPPAEESMTAEPDAKQPAGEEAPEDSSTRKVLGAVQRALFKAATGGSEGPSQPGEAPAFKP